MRLRSANALILLCLSLAAGFGTITAFLIGREHAREAQLLRMARLDADYAFTRVADNPAIRWVEEGREMLLDGRLHDVVATKDSAGIRLYLVIADDRETEVLDSYLDRAGGAGSSDTGYRMPVPSLFPSPWITSLSVERDCYPLSSGYAFPVVTDSRFRMHPFLSVPVPPPLG